MFCFYTLFFFFFNDTATTEIYTLSLHDALPISVTVGWMPAGAAVAGTARSWDAANELEKNIAVRAFCTATRSEEHTSELQSRQYLVCRLLLEKKKKKETHQKRK